MISPRNMMSSALRPPKAALGLRTGTDRPRAILAQVSLGICGLTGNRNCRCAQRHSAISGESWRADSADQRRAPRRSAFIGNPWLFPGDTPGQPVKEIRRFWVGVQKQANLPGVRIHDLRHTFASLLVSGGASLEMIGKLLGHSQMTTTQRYAHLMDSPLRHGVNVVASIFRPRPQLVHDADQEQRSA